jgi:hypothetical protein
VGDRGDRLDFEVTVMARTASRKFGIGRQDIDCCDAGQEQVGLGMVILEMEMD